MCFPREEGCWEETDLVFHYLVVNGSDKKIWNEMDQKKKTEKQTHLFDCKINFALVQTINDCNLAKYIWFGSVSVVFFFSGLFSIFFSLEAQLHCTASGLRYSRLSFSSYFSTYIRTWRSVFFLHPEPSNQMAERHCRHEPTTVP